MYSVRRPSGQESMEVGKGAESIRLDLCSAHYTDHMSVMA